MTPAHLMPILGFDSLECLHCHYHPIFPGISIRGVCASPEVICLLDAGPIGNLFVACEMQTAASPNFQSCPAGGGEPSILTLLRHCLGIT